MRAPFMTRSHDMIELNYVKNVSRKFVAAVAALTLFGCASSNQQPGVSSEANLLDDLGADSLDVVELVMALEEEFGIEVPDEDVESIRTIGDIVQYVGARIEANA